VDDRRAKRTFEASAATLPNGVFVSLGDRAWLVLGAELLAWSPDGYGDRRARPPAGRVMTVLTPEPTVATIRAGYEPDLHPTARSRSSKRSPAPQKTRRDAP